MPYLLLTLSYSDSRVYSCLVNNNVSKDIVRFFFTKKNKQENERTKTTTTKKKNKKWLKIDNVPTRLLVLNSSSKMSSPKSILSCVKRETRQIKTQARYIRIFFWGGGGFTHIVHFVGLSLLSSQAGCRISFSFCLS